MDSNARDPHISHFITQKAVERTGQRLGAGVGYKRRTKSKTSLMFTDTARIKLGENVSCNFTLNLL